LTRIFGAAQTDGGRAPSVYVRTTAIPLTHPPRRAPAQNQSLAPSDYWVSEATAWNYKMASEEKMYKLHDDQATSIKMYAENLGEHVFYYKEQVSVPDGKGGFKVRRC
jgi:hypothetical protein